MPQAIGWDRDFYVNDPSTVKKGPSVAEDSRVAGQF